MRTHLAYGTRTQPIQLSYQHLLHVYYSCSSLKRRQEPRKPSNTGPQSHATNQVRRILRMFSTVVSRFSTRPSCSASRFSTKPFCSARFPIADDFSRARLRFSTRRRPLPIASHPRKPLRSYAHPPGLPYGTRMQPIPLSNHHLLYYSYCNTAPSLLANGSPSSRLRAGRDAYAYSRP